MSRAYCLTCNEQVHETPSGTCPLGHTVAAEDLGPEPWVGFAGDTETDAAAQVPHLDAAGRPREHAVVGHHAHAVPHVNGSANGHATSFPSADLPPPATHAHGPTSPAAHASASDTADDDLAALLAEALREGAVQDPTPPHDGPPSIDTEPSDGGGTDWGELASLAAELQLDEHVATDDGPGTAPEPPEPIAPESISPDSTSPEPAAAWPSDPATSWPEPEAPTDEMPDELSAANIDDLLIELTGGTPSPEPPVSEPTTPPPPPAPAPPAASVADSPIWDTPAPPEDVPSAPAADPADIWADADEVPAVDTPPAPAVDLYNFTARGARVGEAGTARPARKKRGRKR